MDTEEALLEEGEIDDSESIYNPLPRPVNYSVTQNPGRFPIQPSESEEELLSASESDSDSDCKSSHKKKPRLIVKKTKPSSVQTKKKKYDIWSTRVQEDVLANTLNNCDVSLKDRSRDVETYDYSLAKKFYSSKENDNVSCKDEQNSSHQSEEYNDNNEEDNNAEENQDSNKRTRAQRNNSSFRSRRHSKSKTPSIKRTARIIVDLTTNSENTPEEIAKDIANKLYEQKEDLILKTINIAGKNKALEIFKETKRIEADGGMLIMNQTRRRTPGGVFLFLVRHDNDISPGLLRNIFDEDRRKNREIIKNKQKEKFKNLRREIALAREKTLPELLSKAELCVQQLADDNSRVRKESEHVDVTNPPPTPETDGGHESSDGMDNGSTNIVQNDCLNVNRTITTYDDDILDLRIENEMDLL